jgi:hypothetical protein
LIEAIENDRVGFLSDFREGFFNGDSPAMTVSRGVLDWYLIVASQASLRATVACARVVGHGFPPGPERNDGAHADHARQRRYQRPAQDHGPRYSEDDSDGPLHRIRGERSRYWNHGSQ